MLVCLPYWNTFVPDGAPSFGNGHGRDGHCWPPPLQIPACAANAPGLYKGGRGKKSSANLVESAKFSNAG
jgi:hypothetical protein